MKTDSPYDRGDIHINKNDKVLEIGPGHNPTYRSKRDRHTKFSPGVVVISLYSSVWRGMVLTKGTMEPPMRSRP